MPNWTLQGIPLFGPADVDVAFVYLITCIPTGRKYVGKKLFTFAKTRGPLKGKKRKRRERVESDWREYWGSNEELKADVKRLGEHQFTREILRMCRSKAEASYFELKEQLERDVLLKPDEYYNGFVGGKIGRSHVLGKW